MKDNLYSSFSKSPDIWLSIKSDIENKILNGVYAAGERIPSTRKIAEYYGVGQSTAHKVLNNLLLEGVIESKRGIGFYVKPYVREKLMSEKKKDIEKQVISLLQEAELLKIDLISMIGKYANINN